VCVLLDTEISGWHIQQNRLQ